MLTLRENPAILRRLNEPDTFSENYKVMTKAFWVVPQILLLLLVSAGFLCGVRPRR